MLTKEDLEAAYEETYDSLESVPLGCPVMELPGAPEAFAEAIAAIVCERCAQIAETCPLEESALLYQLDVDRDAIAAAIRKLLE